MRRQPPNTCVGCPFTLSTADHDRFTKRRRCYQEVKVPLYWMVDANTQTVEV